MSRIFAILLAVITLCSVCTDAVSAVTLNGGDANMDGGVNSLDASAILRYDAGLISFGNIELIVGDLNMDGLVNNLDAAYVLKYDAGLITDLPLIEITEVSEGGNESEDSLSTEDGYGESEEIDVSDEGNESQEGADSSLPFDEEEEGVFKTSNYSGEYISLRVYGNRLDISGVLEYEAIDAVWIRVFNAKSNTLVAHSYIDVQAHEAFFESIDLGTDTARKYLCIYHHKTGDVLSWSYIDKNRCYLSYGDDGYYLEQSPVLEHNKQTLEEYIDPQDGFCPLLSREIYGISDRLVDSDSGDYEKMHDLYKWVSENVYYDYDFYMGVTDSTNLSPEDVYLNKYSTCQGYANLLCALLQAQGIPCVVTDCYGAFPVDESALNATTPNHVIVEAYLEAEDRWVIMDPTWSSGNSYQNGVFTQSYNLSRYFDITVEELSICHKLIRRASPWFWYL